MNTYYMSYRCEPLAGHENSRRYSGMMADVFITAECADGMEKKAAAYLQKEGWAVAQLDYAELVTSASAHDARFGELYRTALSKGFAAILSPY